VNPTPLKNLKGYYANGVIRITWELPSHSADDTVYTCPIIDTGKEIVLDKTRLYAHRLGIDSEGTNIKFTHQKEESVRLFRYFVFLWRSWEAPPQIETLFTFPEYLVTVTVGNANVSYTPMSKKIGDGFYQHTISLTSDCKLPHGLLLYSFSSAGKEFSVTLPGDVYEGKYEYEPFYTFNPKSQGRISVKSSPDTESQITITEVPPKLFKIF
jgi:hypothetical protein